MKTLVVLEYPVLLLHTKFQGHRPLGSEETDFLSFSPYMGIAMWPGTFKQIFIPHIPWRRHMKLASIGLAVSEQKKFETVESE